MIFLVIFKYTAIFFTMRREVWKGKSISLGNVKRWTLARNS